MENAALSLEVNAEEQVLQKKLSRARAVSVLRRAEMDSLFSRR